MLQRTAVSRFSAVHVPQFQRVGAGAREAADEKEEEADPGRLAAQTSHASLVASLSSVQAGHSHLAGTEAGWAVLRPAPAPAPVAPPPPRAPAKVVDDDEEEEEGGPRTSSGGSSDMADAPHRPTMPSSPPLPSLCILPSDPPMPPSSSMLNRRPGPPAEADAEAEAEEAEEAAEAPGATTGLWCRMRFCEASSARFAASSRSLSALCCASSLAITSRS
jgi:hypothetical protein